MLLRLYRRKIAQKVADKMAYMNSCPNERDIVLHIIAPKDYAHNIEHCNTDCLDTTCKCYHYGMEDDKRKRDGFVQDVAR